MHQGLNFHVQFLLLMINWFDYSLQSRWIFVMFLCDYICVNKAYFIANEYWLGYTIAIIHHQRWTTFSYLHHLQEALLWRWVRGLQDSPDVLGLVQWHLQQVAQHHQLLQLGLSMRRQLQDRRLQSAGHQGCLPGLLPRCTDIWN